MTQDWHARRAGSFGAVAGDYAAARPSYPAHAVGWLTGDLPGLDVADLGAGTGKLTELLVAAGHRVRAVDPSAGMLAQLQERLPEVATLQAPAEAVPMPDASVDVVTAAQAWHWFDQHAAALEAARLLRPGGRLSLVWNERDETVDWVARVWEPVRRGGPVGLDVLEEGWERAIPERAPFGELTQRTFRYEQTLARADVLRLVSSRSNVAVLDEAATDALLTEVADVLDTHPDTRGRDVLTLPYETCCFRWQRLS